jgi:DNA-directed RNA polymerase specialized sigma24 family protein
MTAPAVSECPYSAEDLPVRLRERDGKAWDWVYGRFGPMVYAVAIRKLRDAEARDVVQNVFVEFLRVLESGAQVRMLGGFLHKIAVRRTLDQLKKRLTEESRRSSMDGAAGDDDERSGVQYADDRAAAPDEPSDDAEQQATVRELTLECMQGLPAAERMAAELLVARMRGDSELSWEEIREQVRAAHRKTVNLARVFEKFREAFSRKWRRTSA